MTRRASHAARVESSERLQQTLEVLRCGDWLDGWVIAQQTRSQALHSDIHELRQNGFQIEQRYARTTDNGRRVSQYRLNETQPDGGSPGDSHPALSASQPQPVPGAALSGDSTGSATETADDVAREPDLKAPHSFTPAAQLALWES